VIINIKSEYLYGAVKLTFGEDPSFTERWNPLSSYNPYLIYTSHMLLYNEKERETEYYNCDEFIASLEFGKYDKI
jgi:hypothetical protein